MKIGSFKVLIIILIIAIVFLVERFFFGGLSSLFYVTSNSPTYCTSDGDCVPAQCCHPTSSVNRENAPDCSNQFCTLECKPDTLDCGQGEIKCLNNKCTAIIGE